jgi:uncharacterized protein YlxW (UPF0749 family)
LGHEIKRYRCCLLVRACIATFFVHIVAACLCLQVFASAHTATGQQHKLSNELANMTQQLEAVECMQQVKLQQLSEELAGVQQQLAHAQQQSMELHQSWQQVSSNFCIGMLQVVSSCNNQVAAAEAAAGTCTAAEHGAAPVMAAGKQQLLHWNVTGCKQLQ